MKFDPTIKPIDTVEPLVEERFRGNQLFKTPQPKLTTADATAFVSGADNDITDAAIPVLNNMRTRINEMETAMRNIGLLK
jgi:hypothetical protein